MKRLALLPLLVLPLAACGGGTTSAKTSTSTSVSTSTSTPASSSTSSTSTPTSPSSTASSASSGASTSAAAAPASGSGGDGEDGVGVGGVPTPIGKALTSSTSGSMTVDKVMCGVKTVPYGAQTQDDGTPGVAHATAGDQICAIFATFKNTTNSPLMPKQFGNLTTTDGKSFIEDTDISSAVTANAPDQPASANLPSTVNPEQAIPFRAYFQIPTSSTASRLDWPGGNDAPEGTFQLN